jgi:hypothetical protein
MPFLQKGNKLKIRLLYLYDSPDTFGDSWKNAAMDNQIPSMIPQDPKSQSETQYVMAILTGSQP